MLKIWTVRFAAAVFAAGHCLLGAAQDWKPAASPLLTRWAKDVSPSNALPEYPRPQLTRKDWMSLNGLWNYGVSEVAAPEAPASMDGKILVPYPYESALSGVGKGSIPTQKLWYRRSFSVPQKWGRERVLLHLGAVNYASSVWLNGHNLGAHKGGYDEFSFDVTDKLTSGANELTVAAVNSFESGQVLGKQNVKPKHIFYTGTTGIWQSVWLEPVSATHIERLLIVPDVDASQLRLTVQSSSTAPVKVSVLNGGKVVATSKGQANAELRIPIANAKLWSPDAPHLYDLKVELGSGSSADSVSSYFAMRKVSLGRDAQNHAQIFLNNKFLFQAGLLDQGYWPDGIYTAPTDAAMRSDIESAKKFGFNLLRKHVKVEPARWYYWADRLGMLVWQDMPSMFNGGPAAQAQFEAEWREIIAERINSPSIIVWVSFNEGWGQYDSERIASLTKSLDPSRLVNNASGWTDKGAGDILAKHEYVVPTPPVAEAGRAGAIGEFGGITMNAGHLWTAETVGYGATLTSSRNATRRYQRLLKHIYSYQESSGLSAIVYTQLTDVEQEINGLLTYDRAVPKMHAELVAAANRGQFLPLPPLPNGDLVPTSKDGSTEWKYSFNKPAETWMQTAFDDAAWNSGDAPFGDRTDGVQTPWTSPDIWLRRQFVLPAAIPAKLVLLLKHDEDVEVYVNGVLAYSATGYVTDYAKVPMSDAARATLKPGANFFSVHCHQTVAGQAIDVGMAVAPAR